jgi:hypothetical protein
MASQRAFLSVIALAICLLLSYEGIRGTATAATIKDRELPGQSVNGNVLVRRTDCSRPGNTDLYGLGVRLGKYHQLGYHIHKLMTTTGVYFMWVTSYLANYWVVDEISSSLDQNALFLFAICVGMLKATIVAVSNPTPAVDDPSYLTNVDVVIMLYICYGFIMSVLSVFGYRTKHFGKLHVSVIGSFVRLALTTMVSIYSAWFWFSGLDIMDPTPPGCEPIMFMFAMVRITGHVRFFWRVIAIMYSSYFGILLAMGMFSVMVWCFSLTHAIILKPKSNFKKQWRAFWAYTTKSLSHDERLHFDTKSELTAYRILRVTNALIILLFMVGIEMTINWNHLEGVTNSAGIQSTGQIIPTVIGAASMVRIMWILFMRFLGVSSEEESAAKKRSEKERRDVKGDSEDPKPPQLTEQNTGPDIMGDSKQGHEHRHWAFYGYNIAYLINCRVLIWVVNPSSFKEVRLIFSPYGSREAKC